MLYPESGCLPALVLHDNLQAIQVETKHIHGDGEKHRRQSLVQGYIFAVLYYHFLYLLFEAGSRYLQVYISHPHYSHASCPPCVAFIESKTLA